MTTADLIWYLIELVLKNEEDELNTKETKKTRKVNKSVIASTLVFYLRKSIIKTYKFDKEKIKKKLKIKV